jgi:hypothetical protein
LPFLRFARDKRGYETTALVHAFRGRQGRTRQKVLYWFRTPPNVKVGRPALDQDAIRWIEEHNPDIEFDWPKILEANPQPAPPAEDQRGFRARRGRSDSPERGARPERRSVPRSAPSPVSTVEADLPPAVVVAAPPLPAAPMERLEDDTPDLNEPEEQALEQITHPDSEEALPETRSAVETVLGREQLIRFRARYAELQARIIERGGEPARLDELRAQAETLNPDTWVTLDEAQKGLAEFEQRTREIRAALGLKRRRRSRRGGRRRRAGGAGQAETAGSVVQGQTPVAGSSSNSANGDDADNAEEGDEDGGDEAT